MKIPNYMFSGYSKGGHVQGIAIDTQRGYLYYSFTTELLKTDLQGNLLASVRNLAGHLGCITYDAQRDLLYGSLELKHDIIGRDIMDATGKELSREDAFYLVCFDLEKMDRLDMDAEADGVMKAVYLRDVVEDYTAIDQVSNQPHRYGCSGIDGVALGPAFGQSPDSEPKLMIAYGIYGDTQREDNDYQVLLQLDRDVVDTYGQSLNQLHPHHSGPEICEEKYFFFTGNTTYGVQNLEYDACSRCWFAAVYAGKKEQYTNFNMFVIDGRAPGRMQSLKGRKEEQGYLLMAAKLGEKGLQTYGSFFSYGATGMIALGDGYFLFSQDGYDKEQKSFYTFVHKYKAVPESSELFEEVES